jgi:hypothetical protein
MPSIKKQSLTTILSRAKHDLHELTGFCPESVVSVKEGDNGCITAQIELLEKKGIPDRMDLLGLYKADLTRDGGVKTYERVSLRKRGDMITQETEE